MALGNDCVDDAKNAVKAMVPCKWTPMLWPVHARGKLNSKDLENNVPLQLEFLLLTKSRDIS